MKPSALALPVLDADLEGRLRQRLVRVEEALHGHVVSEADFVTRAARHLLEAGGKRFEILVIDDGSRDATASVAVLTGEGGTF